MGLLWAKLWSLFGKEGRLIHYSCLNVSFVSYTCIDEVLLLRAVWVDRAEHKVIIVGLDNAGKTTILYQL